MNVGELIDTLHEKLNTREINRIDEVYVEGEDSSDSDWYPVEDIHTGYANTLIITTPIRLL